VSGQIDNADAVISKFGDEQPLPLQIDRHVVDAAPYVAQQDLGFELQRALVGCLSIRCGGWSAT
jgi:hypothetical protein